MDHSSSIRDQFTRQAVPFSNAKSIGDAGAIQLLLDAAEARPGQRSLDVACGPGLVALAFATLVEHATGLDATPAMLDRARALQAERGIGNVEWVCGEAEALPFPDDSFDAVTCRFAFHHMQRPQAALAEMLRVARPGGRIVLCDGYAPDEPERSAAFNAFERIRDPSTVRFLTVAELYGLFERAGLAVAKEQRYRLPAEMEGLLRTSFPAAGGEPVLREILAASVEDDGLGLQTRREGQRILFSYPAAILAGRKPA